MSRKKTLEADPKTRTFEFEAIIRKRDSIDATFVEFPFDVEKEFGTKGQVKVNATFDGEPYRGSLAKMGHHCHILGITKEIRSRIEKQAGEKVMVTLQRDTEVRTVEIPKDFAEQLNKDPQIRMYFDQLSYTHRKEYVRWIQEAKRTETREKRVQKAILMLNDKIKHP